MESIVSIIIPTHNRADKLGRALLSIQKQTFNDFEVIIIDDASEDGTDKLVEDFSKYLNIKYIKLNSRCGAAIARNEGIRIAKGRFIAFLDSDDEWVSEKLEEQINRFKMTPQNIGLVYTGILIKKNNKIFEIRKPMLKGNLSDKIFHKNYIGPLSTAVIRRECFNICGLFDEQLPACQDWDLWIRIAQKFEIDFIEKELVLYHISTDSITSNSKARAEGYRLILNKYFGKFNISRTRTSNLQIAIAYHLVKGHDILKGISYFILAIYTHPLNLRGYVNFLKALLISTIRIVISCFKGNGYNGKF